VYSKRSISVKLKLGFGIGEMLFKKINTSEKDRSTRETEKESKESSESNEKGEGVEDKDLDVLFDVVVAVVDDFVVEIVDIDCVARSLAWSWTSQ